MSTVTKCAPSFHAADSYDLAAIERAFREHKHLVREAQVGLRDYHPGSDQNADRVDRCKMPIGQTACIEPGFHILNGRYVFPHFPKAAWLEQAYRRDQPRWLPGLPWTKRGATVVFVTVDGGRYLVEESRIRTLEPLQEPLARSSHDVLMPQDVGILVKGGHLARRFDRSVPPLSAARDQYKVCGEKLREAAEPRLEANDVANISDSTRANREDQILDGVNTQIAARCERAFMTVARTVLVEAAEERWSQRTRLYEAVRKILIPTAPAEK